MTPPLTSIPIFRGIAPAGLRELEQLIERRSVPRGESLFEDGDKRRELIVVVSGKVHVYRMFNNEVQTLAILDQHDFIVESALVDPEVKHQHNAEVTADAELLIIDGRTFRGFAKQHPEIANIVLGNIVVNLAERLHHANNKLVTLYATGRIATSYNDLDNLIDSLLTTIVATIRAKKALFAWYRPLENRIIIEKAIGYSSNVAVETQKLSLREDPILGEIFRTQRDIFVTKAIAKEKPNLKTPYSGQTMLGVKIRTGGKVVGAILLADKEGGHDFSYNNQILLHIIVKQIALAIQEAEVVQEKELNEEHERVYIPPL